MTQRAPIMRNLIGRMSLRNRRVKEKYCFLFILLGFFVICVSMVFFLPDWHTKTTSGVQGVYEKIPELFLGPQPHFPPPPLDIDMQEASKNEIDHFDNAKNVVAPPPLYPPPKRFIEEDKARLYAKIRQEEQQNGILEKPKLLNVISSSTSKNVQMKAPAINEDVLSSSFQKSPMIIDESRPWLKLNKKSPVLIQGGIDEHAETASRRDFIAQMMKDAWDNYEKYAWGTNELKPISKKGHSASIFGSAKIGATIVDALDTVYIMGLNEEYERGRKWIEENLNFDKIRSEVSVFETNIRFVGGLLSLYSLTGDEMFKEKAVHVARKLLPAFDTSTGIPLALVSVHSQASKNYGWASSGSSILSELGTLHLEFTYLSDVTGDPVFKEKVYKIRDVLKNMEKPRGLYSNYVHPRMGKFTQSHISLGALGDSFYEYLLKSYIQTGDADAREMYDAAIEAFEKNGLIRYSKNGLLYVAEMRYDRIESKMDHLACFSGGMFALGARTDPKLLKNGTINYKDSRYMKIAEGVTNTCHESYIRTPTRLGPESFRFSDAMEARALRQNEKYYILRPEVIESYFVLWRLTGDKKYRDWGWDAAQAIEKYCKAGPGLGYSGLRNVYSREPQQDDVQQSFFLAETLKYLYLLFSSDELIDLDHWVFNTEAHPLPIKGVNPYYRGHEGSSNPLQ